MTFENSFFKGYQPRNHKRLSSFILSERNSENCINKAIYPLGTADTVTRPLGFTKSAKMVQPGVFPTRAFLSGIIKDVPSGPLGEHSLVVASLVLHKK